MSNTLTFKISIPTKNGFFGRECKSPDCKRYFKIHQDSFKDEMYCPYCGLLFNKNELQSQEQSRYFQEKIIENVKAYAVNEARKIFKSAGVKQSVSSTPGRSYRKKYISKPTEKDVDSEIECSECGAKFQVYGIFGYCPICKCDNVMIYDTNISIILNEIDKTPDKNRALRHAYNELVSTFEDFCKKRNKTKKKYNFQNLESAGKFFKNAYNINFFEGLKKSEILTIKRLFQKRHICQHNKCIIDQKYIDIIPEDTALLGQKADLNIKEFISATKVLKKIILKII